MADTNIGGTVGADTVSSRAVYAGTVSPSTLGTPDVATSNLLFVVRMLACVMSIGTISSGSFGEFILGLS